MTQPHFAQNDKDEWLTPRSLLDTIEAKLGRLITTDPCASPVTTIGWKHNWTAADDGLSKPWPGVVFCNPPFSDKEAWLAKAVSEYETGEADLVFVVTPDSTDTISWWHKHISGTADYVWFKESRLSYETVTYDYVWFNGDRVDYFNHGTETMGSPTFGTAISIYGEPGDDLLEWFAEEGHLVETVTFE
jgi:hypothetical protein